MATISNEPSALAAKRLNKGESARIINRGTVKIETEPQSGGGRAHDGSIESIVDRIRRRRLVKTDDGKFKVAKAAEAEKNDTKDETKTDSKTEERRTESTAQSATTKASDLTKQLVLVDTGVDDSKKFDLQNFGNTNFPRNTPVYINGPKGSGKTYLLSAVLQYVFKHDLCRRMFYIYAENVDTTISRAVPKDKIYQIPKAIALGIMIKYLSKKTRLCSCSRFVISYLHFDGKSTFGTLTLDELMATNVYWDNMLDELSKRKKIFGASEMYEYCKKVVKKYSTDTIIRIGTVEYNVGNITDNDYDIFVIDDIAQFYDLWGNTRNKSPLYKYFTITRQNMTTFYLAGQELGQLPKMFREQLGGIVLMYGTDVDDLSKYRFNKRMREDIEEKFATMSNHEGVLYNYNTRTLETIRS